MDEEKFGRVILVEREVLINFHDRTKESDMAETLVEATIQLVHGACKESIPRKKTRRERRSAYWWSKRLQSSGGNAYNSSRKQFEQGEKRSIRKQPK